MHLYFLLSTYSQITHAHNTSSGMGSIVDIETFVAFIHLIDIYKVTIFIIYIIIIFVTYYCSVVYPVGVGGAGGAGAGRAGAARGGAAQHDGRAGARAHRRVLLYLLQRRALLPPPLLAPLDHRDEEQYQPTQ